MSTTFQPHLLVFMCWMRKQFVCSWWEVRYPTCVTLSLWRDLKLEVIRNIYSGRKYLPGSPSLVSLHCDKHPPGPDYTANICYAIYIICIKIKSIVLASRSTVSMSGTDDLWPSEQSLSLSSPFFLAGCFEEQSRPGLGGSAVPPPTTMYYNLLWCS